MARNPYKILGVDPDAGQDVIDAAYKALVKRYHERGSRPDENAWREINLAYAAVSGQASAGTAGSACSETSGTGQDRSAGRCLPSPHWSAFIPWFFTRLLCFRLATEEQLPPLVGRVDRQI